MKHVLFCTLAFACAACTPGALSATSGSAGASVTGATTTIDVDLTRDPGGQTPAGPGAGYAPVVASIAVGDGVRFSNSDGFAHTATSFAGTTFPSAYPFTNAALSASGSTLSAGFSSGSLAAGTTSATLLADRTGTYLFGCFYHYGSPMRAVVEVR